MHRRTLPIVVAVLALAAGCSAAGEPEAGVTSAPSRSVDARLSPTPSSSPTESRAEADARATADAEARAAAQVEVEASAAEAAAAGVAAKIERACQEARDFRDRFAGDPDLADAWMVTLTLKTEAELAGLAACDDLAADVEYSRRMIANNSYTVGVDIPAGTYTTLLGGLEDCYWERSGPTGATIANDFITFSPQPISVTVADGEGFTVDGCGLWVAPSPVR